MWDGMPKLARIFFVNWIFLFFNNLIGLICLGIEARGFMFAPCIALAIGAKFVPLRKRGKLPGMC